jgi:hypothetical protein
MYAWFRGMPKGFVRDFRGPGSAKGRFRNSISFSTLNIGIGNWEETPKVWIGRQLWAGHVQIRSYPMDIIGLKAGRLAW